jgi:hypothetical protein
MESRLPSSSGCGPPKNARSRGSLSSTWGKQHASTAVTDAAASRMPACVLQCGAGGGGGLTRRGAGVGARRGSDQAASRPLSAIRGRGRQAAAPVVGGQHLHLRRPHRRPCKALCVAPLSMVLWRAHRHTHTHTHTHKRGRVTPRAARLTRHDTQSSFAASARTSWYISTLTSQTGSPRRARWSAHAVAAACGRTAGHTISSCVRVVVVVVGGGGRGGTSWALSTDRTQRNAIHLAGVSAVHHAGRVAAHPQVQA